MWLWIWLVIAVAAAIGEMLTYDLFLASVSGAAIVTAFAALVAPWPLQLPAFAVLSLLGILLVRPAAKVALGLGGAMPPSLETMHRTVVGRKAVVTSTVTGDGGQVKIGNGEFWSARAYDPDDSMAPGTDVRVVLVDGVAALVEPVVSLEVPDVTPASEVFSEKGNQ
jgi:membrane protein implicated in regulation of membrane protease activity